MFWVTRATNRPWLSRCTRARCPGLGSACQAGVPQPSHVLLAMGISEDDARGALRLTLGHTSTDADVAAFLDALPPAVERARRARSAGRSGR